MKSVLPWIIVVALLGGNYYFYSANKDKDAQIAKLTQNTQDLETLRAENEELKKLPAQNEELARLREENKDVLRLRGEVQQLHDKNKQLTAQLASVQATEGSEAEQARRLADENAALHNQTQKIQQTQAQAVAQQQMDVCINNLRQIDAAKQQWALENKKTADDVPTAADITPYLPNNGAQLACPSGGVYTINAVGVPPTCSIPGHTLAK